jgi:serine/threonine protein kinase
MIDEDIIFQDKYLVGRKLGSGSFGAILLGTDLSTGKYVAIKFVRIIAFSQNLIFNRRKHQ